MTSKEVKLLGTWFSAFSDRIKIGLKIKGAEFESVEENLVSKSDLLLKSNPVHKKIPVLIHGDRTICESLVIIQYIDQVWTTSGWEILPADPYDRAVARFWAAFMDDKWFPKASSIAVMDDAEKAAAMLEEVTQEMGLFEDYFTQCSKGQNFFGGDKIGFIDIVFGSFIPWIRVLERVVNANLFDEAKFPHLSKWAQDFSNNECVKNVVADADQVFEFAKVQIPARRAAGKQ